MSTLYQNIISQKQVLLKKIDFKRGVYWLFPNTVDITFDVKEKKAVKK